MQEGVGPVIPQLQYNSYTITQVFHSSPILQSLHTKLLRHKTIIN